VWTVVEYVTMTGQVCHKAAEELELQSLVVLRFHVGLRTTTTASLV
jgi:hypothetical protein